MDISLVMQILKDTEYFLSLRKPVYKSASSTF